MEKTELDENGKFFDIARRIMLTYFYRLQDAVDDRSRARECVLALHDYAFPSRDGGFVPLERALVEVQRFVSLPCRRESEMN